MEQRILERCYQTGQEAPDAIRNAPRLRLGLGLFLDAFWWCHSCRPSGMDVGTIPSTAIAAYCDYMELPSDMHSDVFHHVRALDEVYLTYQRQTKS